MAKRRSRGEGSITYWEAKKLWVARVTLPDGKRKTKYGHTQKEVKDWLLETRKTLKDGYFIADDKITLEQFLNRYMQDFAVHSLKPSTYHNYSTMIRLYIVPDLGHLRLTQLRADHLHSLYEKKREAGLSPRMLQYIHGLLHRTLNRAVKWGLLTINPCDLAEAPSYKKKEMKTWTSSEVKQFLAAVDEDRWKALYITACGTGLREGELLALTWDNLDLAEGKLKVVSNLLYIPGHGLIFAQPKSDKSRRLVMLPEFVIQSLKDHQIRQEVLKQSPGWKGDSLVFTTNIGTPISPRNLVRDFKNKVQSAGLPEIRFHDLRHTVATLLLEKNTHPLIVSSLLGHSSVNLTLSTYSHVLPTLAKEAANTMDEIVSH